MLDRFHTARLLPPTLFAMAGVALLIGLGLWQLERRAWKEGLIARIAERANADPVNLTAGNDEFLQVHVIGDAEYTRVTARGRFAHDKELYFYAPDPKRGPGFHVYTPLTQANGLAVFVNRGYVPEAYKPRVSRPSGLPEGEVAVTGLLRNPGEAGLFTPENNVGSNLWFWRDLDGMKRAAFGESPPATLPFFIDAGAEPGQTSWPRGGVTRLDLPNRHLEYALTWFGLAATLIAVYAAFALGRVRRGTS